ncbi:MAG: hypothetical protein HZB92_04650 [Euryarchaeota archaeon]|nr:hypothetical protein [Euryarchaeota archaeon]
MSARETELVEEMGRRGIAVFGLLEASKVLRVERLVARKALSRLASKGAIKRIERGKYVIARFYSEMDVYELAPRVHEPSYLSLWSGLHHYGYTTQVPAEVYLVTARARRGLDLQDRRVRYVRVRPRMFFGYRADGRVVVAEPEKLVLDCLAFPSYSGGYGELRDAVEKAELGAGKLVDYALRAGSPTVCSRLGHLLDDAGISFDERRLQRHASRSYVWLDPSAPSESFETVRKWKVYANVVRE